MWKYYLFGSGGIQCHFLTVNARKGMEVKNEGEKEDRKV